MLARLARRGAHRRAHRPRQPPRAGAATSSARLAATPRDGAPARARAVRPRRLQALQRHLRPSGGRRPPRPPRRQPRRATSTAAVPRFRMGGDEFCALVAARRRASPTPILARRRRGALRARRGLHDRLLLRRDRRSRARRRDAARGPADRRPADVRAEARRPDVGEPPEQGRPPASARRAQPRARRPPRRRRRPRRGHRARGSGCPTRRSTSPPRRRAPRRRQGRHPRRDPQQARPARRPRVGVHPPPHRRSASASSPRRPRSSRVAELVRSSHERWDGAGYPDGLAGEAIPLGSRIVAVADAFDAMTTDRPYRAARAPEDALAELRRCAGPPVRPRRRRGLLRRPGAGPAGSPPPRAPSPAAPRLRGTAPRGRVRPRMAAGPRR